MNTNEHGSGTQPATEVKAPDRSQPTTGRIVWCTMKDKQGRMVTRPAMVVHAWRQFTLGETPCAINAQVFCDGDGSFSNDGLPNTVWKTSLAWDPTGASPHTWRWPEREHRKHQAEEVKPQMDAAERPNQRPTELEESLIKTIGEARSKALALCHKIETLGCSYELTKASVMCSDLHRLLNDALPH